MNNNASEGVGRRIAVTVVTFFASIIGIIIWLSFFAGNFGIYQNIAVVIVIILTFIATAGATWAVWGIKHGARLGGKSDPQPGSHK
ncbi:MAG: hypothetical protein ABI347_01810 [Nitrososphaera sp.]